MSNKDTFEKFIEGVIAKASSGAPLVDDILSSHPEWKEEAEAAYLAALALSRVTPPAADESFKSATRAQLMAKAAEQSAALSRTKPSFSLSGWMRNVIASPKWAFAAAAMLVMVVATGTAVAASGSSQPGSPLYGVKRAVERVQIFAAFSDVSRARLSLRDAERRLDELKTLVEAGEADKTAELRGQLASSAARFDERASELVGEAGPDERDEIRILTRASFTRQRDLLIALFEEIPTDGRERLARAIGAEELLREEEDEDENRDGRDGGDSSGPGPGTTVPDDDNRGPGGGGRDGGEDEDDGDGRDGGGGDDDGDRSSRDDDGDPPEGDRTSGGGADDGGTAEPPEPDDDESSEGGSDSYTGDEPEEDRIQEHDFTSESTADD